MFKVVPPVAKMFWGNMAITITSPVDGESIGYRRKIMGIVYPPLSKIQVLIFANDNFWYRQNNPIMSGANWEIDDCYFGREDSYGAGFKIIALDGTALLANRVANLPSKGARSNIVAVSRLPRPRST
jgi:hypothetical protein